MPKLLSEVSIICLPSYREGMPMVLQEAASCNLPVITSNVTGCKEVIIKNKTGFLVQVKNVNSLVKKLILLIRDSKLRQKFGNEGRKFAIKNFDESLIIKQNLNIYNNLLKNEKNKQKKLILIELNEINFDIVKKYISNTKLKNFSYIINNNFKTTTSEKEYSKLEPWIQWVSIHTGMEANEHKIFRLGEAKNFNYEQILKKYKEKILVLEFYFL